MFQKINTGVMFLVIALGVVLMVVTLSEDYILDDKTKECISCGVGAGAGIILSYVLLIGAVVAALAGAVMQAVMNPSNMKGAAIGIGGLIVVLAIGYFLADGTVEPYYQSGITETVSKLTGMGLYALYILFVLAVLSIAYASVSRLLK